MDFDILEYEKKYWNMGCKYVAGADEAGRGPLAGPVYAAAVILKPGTVIEGLTDSKKLSETLYIIVHFGLAFNKKLLISTDKIDNHVIFLPID